MRAHTLELCGMGMADVRMTKPCLWFVTNEQSVPLAASLCRQWLLNLALDCKEHWRAKTHASGTHSQLSTSSIAVPYSETNRQTWTALGATGTESSPNQCLRICARNIEEHWLTEDGQPVAHKANFGHHRSVTSIQRKPPKLPVFRHPRALLLELGSGLQISKLAFELLLGLGASVVPILKFEHPTPTLIGWPLGGPWTFWTPNRGPCERGVW